VNGGELAEAMSAMSAKFDALVGALTEGDLARVERGRIVKMFNGRFFYSGSSFFSKSQNA
jgi:hypothetical protein